MAKYVTEIEKVTVNKFNKVLVTEITEQPIKYGEHRIMDMIETIIARECHRTENAARRLAKALNPKGRRAMTINIAAEHCTMLIEFGRRRTRVTLVMDSGDEFVVIYDNDQYFWLFDYVHATFLYNSYQKVMGLDPQSNQQQKERNRR